MASATDMIGCRLYQHVKMAGTNHDIIPKSPLERFKSLQNDLRKRLNTFKNYPKDAIKSKEDLADNGFHYIGDGKDDKVQCVFCGIIVNNWTKEDDITSEHRRFSRDCTHIYQLDRKNFGANVNGGLSRADLIRNSLKSETNGKIPEMKEVTLRLNSFHDWRYTKEEKPSPEALSKAGLFYTGKGDTTQCWFCGNLLEEWEPGDIPKHEHDINFPECKLAAH